MFDAIAILELVTEAEGGWKTEDYTPSQAWWCLTVISVLWEAESGGS